MAPKDTVCGFVAFLRSYGRYPGFDMDLSCAWKFGTMSESLILLNILYYIRIEWFIYFGNNAYGQIMAP